jgi:protein-S-isoprenylcysteine O-methyltransferase Ste14
VRPYFGGHPVAEAIFLFGLGVWFVIETRQALNRRSDATNTDRRSLLVLRACVAAGILLGALALRVMSASFPYNPIVTGVAVAAVWGGVGLRWWSFRTLGRYFTFTVMTSADQPIITTGPYRVLRHPSYTGLLLIISGIGLSFGNWLGFAALTLPTVIGLVNRINVEEAALSRASGSAYITFAAGRKRIIPFVW